MWLSASMPAGAHVTLNPREAPKGGRARFDIRVPNERPDASTVKLEVQMPQEHAFPTVRVQPVPGWTYTIARKKLPTPIGQEEGADIEEAVASITWEGGEIKPDEFVEFPISMGPLPENADRLLFKAIQTYSNGEVVRWIEVPEAGKPEPEHPAPAVKLVAAAAADPTAAASPPATGERDGSGGEAGTTLAIVLSILALLVSIGAVARGRKQT
jgi:uncharacterized protein